MSKVLRLVLFLLLPLLSNAAHALIPAVSNYEARGPYYAYGSSFSAACSAAIALYNKNSAKTTATGGWTDQNGCYVITSAGDEYIWVVVAIGKTCPANSTLTNNDCTCVQGYEEKDNQCVKPKNCRLLDVASSGYFDAGKSTAGGPSIMACVGGCETIFDGEFPAGNSLVNGEKHYYAKGQYLATGRECTAPDSDIGKGVPVTEIPPDTCAEGYVMGKVSGKNVCSKGGAAPGSDSTSKPDPNKATTSTNTEVKKDKDADGNDRETTTVTKKNADGSTTTETTVKVTKGDGNGGTTTNTSTTTVTTGGSGKGSGSGSGSDDGDDDGEDSEKGKCEKNSSDEGCGGAAASIDGKTFYTAKEKTFSGIFGKASTDLRASGMGGAFTGFFNVAAGGSCPATTWHVGYVNADVPFDFMCQSWALNGLLMIKTVLLVIATFMAARIALE